MEAKLLAFPVRSLAGCFAWLTCPAVLERFQRDTGRLLKDGHPVTIPQPDKDKAIAGPDLVVDGKVVFEEYAMDTQPVDLAAVAQALKPLSADPLWQDKVEKRLAIVHDENFQHFVTSCTEVVARIVINPATRTNENLFYQENVPCETLFYSVLTVMPSRRTGEQEPAGKLADLLAKTQLLQIGGDETTGHGLCEVKTETLAKKEAN
jgi:CRISPR-associated protein Cmr4